MGNIYLECPTFENKRFLIRLLSTKDSLDLLKVYSDEQVVSLCNDDNCLGGFLFQTKEVMDDVIKWWLKEYMDKGFVRMSIIDKATTEAIGTIEIFHRDSHDFFTNCTLLRLDLRSDYEKTDDIIDILSLFIDDLNRLFKTDKIAIKAKPHGVERINALIKLGFSRSNEPLIGSDGNQYREYYYK